MPPFTGVKVTVDQLPALYLALRVLSDDKVLAGIPEERGRRKDKGPITNAALGYIHEHGDPANGLPARPFLVPAVSAMKSDIATYLRKAADLAFKANPDGVTRVLNALGLLAQNKIRAEINAGIPPPLARSTLLERIRSRQSVKAAKAELAYRDATGDDSTYLAKPLIRTGQLRNSITYVIRSARSGRTFAVGKPGSWEKWNAKV